MASWFQNLISNAGQAVNAPVIFDWDTDAARRDVLAGNNKRGPLSAAAVAMAQEELDRIIKDLRNQPLPPLTQEPEHTQPIAQSIPQAQANAQAQAQANAQAQAQAEADQLLRGLGQFDAVRRNQDAQAQSDYNKAIAGFEAQDARDLGRYNEQVAQNEANLSRQRQQALLASAQGQRGLNAVLASLGALGGTGIDLANRAVAQSANRDLGEARDTFNTNATDLTNTWSDAKQKQEQRKEDARAQLQALVQNNANTALTGKQNLFRDIANLFDQNSGQRANYLGQAANLGSQISATTRPVNSQFMKADPTFSPEALKNYLAGASDMTVNTQASGNAGSVVPINSPLFAATDKRRERQLM